MSLSDGWVATARFPEGPVSDATVVCAGNSLPSPSMRNARPPSGGASAHTITKGAMRAKLAHASAGVLLADRCRHLLFKVRAAHERVKSRCSGRGRHQAPAADSPGRRWGRPPTSRVDAVSSNELLRSLDCCPSRQSANSVETHNIHRHMNNHRCDKARVCRDVPENDAYGKN